jgi:hypothetical protein
VDVRLAKRGAVNVLDELKRLAKVRVNYPLTPRIGRIRASTEGA